MLSFSKHEPKSAFLLINKTYAKSFVILMLPSELREFLLHIYPVAKHRAVGQRS